MQAIKEGVIPFGYPAVDHRACASRDWTEVRSQLALMGRQKAGVSQALRELKDFYELGDDTLWFTIADGHIWWAFASGPVIGGEEGGPNAPARYRRTRDGWRNTSSAGIPLSVFNLSSALTRTAGYRMTICAVKSADYLIRKIMDDTEPLRAEALVSGALELTAYRLTSWCGRGPGGCWRRAARPRGSGSPPRRRGPGT